MIWGMKDIRLESISAPFAESGAGPAAARVIAFAATTGLLENVNVRSLDMPTWETVLKRLRDLGIGKIQGTATTGDIRSEELSRAINMIYSAIEASPMPSS